MKILKIMKVSAGFVKMSLLINKFCSYHVAIRKFTSLLVSVFVLLHEHVGGMSGKCNICTKFILKKILDFCRCCCRSNPVRRLSIIGKLVKSTRQHSWDVLHDVVGLFTRTYNIMKSRGNSSKMLALWRFELKNCARWLRGLGGGLACRVGRVFELTLVSRVFLELTHCLTHTQSLTHLTQSLTLLSSP